MKKEMKEQREKCAEQGQQTLTEKIEVEKARNFIDQKEREARTIKELEEMKAVMMVKDSKCVELADALANKEELKKALQVQRLLSEEKDNLDPCLARRSSTAP